MYVFCIYKNSSDPLKRLFHQVLFFFRVNKKNKQNNDDKKKVLKC